MELTYFVPGHGQSENDTAHSTIERQYRNRTILTPMRWKTTIEQGFKQNECIVTVLTHDDIIDFKNSKAFPAYCSISR